MHSSKFWNGLNTCNGHLNLEDREYLVLILYRLIWCTECALSGTSRTSRSPRTPRASRIYRAPRPTGKYLKVWFWISLTKYWSLVWDSNLCLCELLCPLLSLCVSHCLRMWLLLMGKADCMGSYELWLKLKKNNNSTLSIPFMSLM